MLGSITYASIHGKVSTRASIKGAVSTNISITGKVNVASVAQLPLYNGPHEITPKSGEEQILQTTGKRLDRDITVHKVPYWETSNDYGETVYIANEA